VALITGAGGGIGRATAEVLAAEGVLVAAGDLNLATAEETARAAMGAVATGAGTRAIALPLDVTSPDSAAAAVERVEREAGPIDILVNCAGIYRIGQLADVDTEAWERLLAINLTGTFHMCKAVLPGMIERQRGSVVNLSSISGRTKAFLAAPSYVTSKAGVIGLTMSLASQSAGSGVRVNAVAPGPVATDMILGLPEHLQSGLVASIPMGRLGTALEVAQAIAFLASDAAAFITGETLNVNGGAFMV
jgi:NAD(P)-dependent dehydrogenase (short-subunit alcohol dehydrogenase family)